MACVAVAATRLTAYFEAGAAETPLSAAATSRANWVSVVKNCTYTYRLFLQIPSSSLAASVKHKLLLSRMVSMRSTPLICLHWEGETQCCAHLPRLPIWLRLSSGTFEIFRQYPCFGAESQGCNSRPDHVVKSFATASQFHSFKGLTMTFLGIMALTVG